MVRTISERETERRQLRQSITNLEAEVRSLSTRLQRLEVEENEEEVPRVVPPARRQVVPPPTQIRIGDRVNSRNAPYHNGIVENFSDDGYWVYIRNAKDHLKKKAIHNVERA